MGAGCSSGGAAVAPEGGESGGARARVPLDEGVSCRGVNLAKLVPPSASVISPQALSQTRARALCASPTCLSRIACFARRVPMAVRHISPKNPWLDLLSPEQIIEIHGAFKQFDRNGDGHIDVSEVQTVMRNLGYPKTKEEVEAIIASVDTDANGTLEFEEFVSMMGQRMLRTDGQLELEMAFESLFDNESGYALPPLHCPYPLPSTTHQPLYFASPHTQLRHYRDDPQRLHCNGRVRPRGGGDHRDDCPASAG